MRKIESSEEFDYQKWIRTNFKWVRVIQIILIVQIVAIIFFPGVNIGYLTAIEQYLISVGFIFRIKNEIYHLVGEKFLLCGIVVGIFAILGFGNIINELPVAQSTKSIWNRLMFMEFCLLFLLLISFRVRRLALSEK